MTRRATALVDAVRQQILSAIDSGIWAAGARLPSTREMSAQLGVDPRTITRAYRQLASEGLIELRPRSGAYVARAERTLEGAPAGLTESWIVDVLAQSVRRETPIMGVSESLRRATESVRLRVFVIAAIADQVAGLKRELSLYYGLEASGATADEVAGGIPLGLRQADLVVTLESTRAYVESLRVDAAVICVSVRPDIVGPAWERLMQSPTYVIVSDERFGLVLSAFLSGRPGAADVKLLVAGRDDVSAIPETAVVYITQSARDVLGTTPIKGSVLPQVQVISEASSAEILSFIVSSNLGAVRARRGLS